MSLQKGDTSISVAFIPLLTKVEIVWALGSNPGTSMGLCRVPLWDWALTTHWQLIDIVPLLTAFPLLSHFLTPLFTVSWYHLSIKLLPSNSLFESLLLGEPHLKQCLKDTIILQSQTD